MIRAVELDTLLEPLSLCLNAESARRLMAYHIDDSVHARIETLAERANEGSLKSGRTRGIRNARQRRRFYRHSQAEGPASSRPHDPLRLDAATRRFVRERARYRCEYCLLHQRHRESRAGMPPLQFAQRAESQRNLPSDRLHGIAVSSAPRRLGRSPSDAGRLH
jgi:hypothetical protein